MAQGYTNGFPVDNDPSLAANSTVLVPSQSAVKAYVAAIAGFTLPLPINQGGTGNTNATDAFNALSPLSALGDILYNNGTNDVRLVGNTTTTKLFLTQTGTGTVSAAPAWGALVNGDIPAALTGKTYEGLTLTAAATGWTIAGGTTSKTLTLSNTMTLAGTDGSTLNISTGGTLGSAAFTSSSAYEPTITTLAVNKGGTGQTSYTDGQLLIGNTTGNTLTKATLTQGTGITVTNGNGSITIANSDLGSSQNIFKNVAVSGQNTIVADSNNDTLTVAAGTAITLTTSDTTDTLTITNAGVTSFSAGTTGFTPSTGTTGAITLAGTLAIANGGTGNTTYTDGQLLIGNTTGNTLTKATLTQGTGITVTNGSGAITITNSAPDQTVSLANGTGITVSGTYPSFTVTNSDLGSSQNIFKNVAVSGQNTIVADSNNDTLTFAAGTGVTLTTSDTTDTLTITNSAPDQTVSLSNGTGITVSGTYPSFTITNSDRGSSQNVFKNVAVSGQSTIVADTNDDTLTVAAGTGITITTDAGTDTLTIAVSSINGGTF